MGNVNICIRGGRDARIDIIMMTYQVMVSTRMKLDRKSTLKQSNLSLMIMWLLQLERCQTLM